jgi:hypothetical protein
MREAIMAKNQWTVRDIIVSALSGGAILSFIGTIATTIVAYKNHAAEIDTKMVELSVGILGAEVKPETAPLREWAVAIINSKADVRFTKRQEAVLLNYPLALYPFSDQSGVYKGPIKPLLPERSK